MKHKFWNDNSSLNYFQLGGKELKFTTLHPKIVNLAQAKQGKNLLDFGCGAGILTHKLAQTMPNAKVLGVDISEQGIRQAKQNHQSQENLHFEQVSPEDYRRIEAMAPFDVVTLSLIIDNLPDLASAKFLLQNLFTWMTSGGSLIIGEAHPCFKDNFFATTTLGLNIKDYRQTWITHLVELFDAFTAKKTVEFNVYHYPLEVLVEIVCQAGFLISAIHEVYDIDDPDYHPEVRKRFNPHVPHFLVIEAVKPRC